MSSLDDWTAAVACELDLAGAPEADFVLDLARDVAHAVARPAAPLTTYLLGMAVGAGADPAAAAARIRALTVDWPPADV